MENETPPEPPQPQPAPESAPPSNSSDLVDKVAVIFSKYPQVSSLGEGSMSEQDEKLWSLGCHLGSLVCASSGLGFVPPLVIYLTQKDKSPYVACHSKEALNFHLSYLIFGLICLALFWLFLPILIAMVGGVIMLIAGIVASIKSYEGGFIALPFTIRMIK